MNIRASTPIEIAAVLLLLGVVVSSSVDAATPEPGKMAITKVPPPVEDSESPPRPPTAGRPHAHPVPVRVVPLYATAATGQVCDVYVDYDIEKISRSSTKRVRWVISKVLDGDAWDYLFTSDGIQPLETVDHDPKKDSNKDNFEAGSGSQEDDDGGRAKGAYGFSLKGSDKLRPKTHYSIVVVAYAKNGTMVGPCFIRDPIIVNQD